MLGEQQIFLFDSNMMDKSRPWKVTHVAGEHWFLVEREFVSIEVAVQTLKGLVRMPLFGFCFKDYIIPAVIIHVHLDLRDRVRLSMSFKELNSTEVETESINKEV